MGARVCADEPAGVSTPTRRAGNEGEVEMSLYWRIFLLNAAVLVAAVSLLLGPVTVSTPVLFGEAVVLLGGWRPC